MTHTNVDSNIGDEDKEDNDRLDDMLVDVEDNFKERPNVFKSILKGSKTELFKGCVKYTVLSTVLKLFNMKTRRNATDEFFSEILETLADMLPDENPLLTNTYKAKKLMCPMGLECEKIHACPKDGVLYRNEYANMENCPRCGLSRYKIRDSSVKKKGVPAKVLWYLPIIPRFKISGGLAGRRAKCDVKYPEGYHRIKEFSKSKIEEVLDIFAGATFGHV